LPIPRDDAARTPEINEVPYMRFVADVAFCVLPILSLGCAAPVGAPDAPDAVAETAQADGLAPLDVDFAGCTEVANVGLAPTANVRPLVPAEFTLVETTGADTTELVVRSVHCDAISVAGAPAIPGDLIQIGAVIVAPQGDGDINNYTLFYDTNDLELALGLVAQGVPARFVPFLHESLHVNPDGTGQYAFEVPPPFEPPLSFAGPVGVRSTTPIPFTANWWFTTNRGTIKMASSFPELFAAGNGVVLTVPEHTKLAGILGTTTVSSWPVLELFDTLPTGQMHVALTE
jgi:hypothetical protein